MEISPIPGVQQDFTAVKAPTADFQLTTVVSMEPVARADQSARPAARKKAAGAEEMEAEEQAPSSENPDSPDDPALPHISFFA
jgi:hypothetical protein